MEVLRGWVGIEEKLDGDGRVWKSHLRGRMGVLSVLVQVLYFMALLLRQLV